MRKKTFRGQAIQVQPIMAAMAMINPVLGIPAVPKMEHIVLLAHSSDPVQCPEDFPSLGILRPGLQACFSLLMRIPAWPPKKDRT